MRFEITVAVWGPWHVNAFARAMLPTLLAPGNLPDVAAHFDARLRILTRAIDRSQIEALEGIRACRDLLPTEVTVATDRDYVSATMHHRWWHDAARAAAANCAIAVMLPPDVVWPMGALLAICNAMTTKVAVLAPPHFRVVSETLLPALEAVPRAGPSLDLAPADLIALGLKHIHPMAAAVMPRGRYGRPSVDYFWPVDGEGIVVCQTAREIAAFDPSRCDLSVASNITNISEIGDVHSSTSSEDFCMLSLAPLGYELRLYLDGLPQGARELAHWSTHPDNDGSLNEGVARQLVRLKTDSVTPARWQIVEDQARAWVERFVRWRELYALARDLRREGRYRAAGLCALAAQTIDIERLDFPREPLTLFIPSDEALGALPPDAWAQLLAPGHEANLLAFLAAHIIRGRMAAPLLAPGIVIERTLDIGSNLVHFIDRCLSSIELKPA